MVLLCVHQCQSFGSILGLSALGIALLLFREWTRLGV